MRFESKSENICWLGYNVSYIQARQFSHLKTCNACVKLPLSSVLGSYTYLIRNTLVLFKLFHSTSRKAFLCTLQRRLRDEAVHILLKSM